MAADVLVSPGRETWAAALPPDGAVPATPGGLGLVEASLTGLLVLAQVDSSQALLATLTYRLASYWAPLCAGPIAYGIFWIRYRSRRAPPQASLART